MRRDDDKKSVWRKLLKISLFHSPPPYSGAGLLSSVWIQNYKLGPPLLYFPFYPPLSLVFSIPDGNPDVEIS